MPAILYSFEFNTSNMDKLNTIEFKTANREWMRFVIRNRTQREQQHNYDIVIGPTANDNTLTAIGLFFAGAYGDVKSDLAIDRLIEQLVPHKLPLQFYFGSKKAVEFLSFIKRDIL